MKSPSAALATVAVTFAISGPAPAQTVPDAGTLRQQIERQQGQPLPRQAAPKLAPTPEPLTGLPAITVTLKSVKFVGNTRLSSEQLRAVVQRYLNQPQNFSQLQQVAVGITNAYREAGWLVRAYLPQQDLSSGELTIQIIEAVFGNVSLEGSAAARIKFDQVARIFQKQHPSGQPVNLAALDRALLLADDLPGVAATGNLVEGQRDGETGLGIKLANEPLATGEVSLDNAGNRSTGHDRLSANLYLNSPLGVGDLLSASATHTQGSDYLRLAASLPVGSDGWRVGANASVLNYRIISPEFAALDSKGDSGGLGLEATYPLVRARTRNLYFSASLEQKSFHNESNAAVQSDYRSRSTGLGLSGNAFDNWGGGGASSASLTLVNGNNALGSLDTSENTALEGSFDKLRYTLTRQQVVTPAVSLYAALAGQHTSQLLDSSEKFTLGGSNGVRAYPSSEGSGSRGQLFNLELRWRLPQGLGLTGFYDWGNVNNLDASPSYSLQGAGLGLAWQPANRINLKAVWAHRLGSNPNPTATGRDQDGSLDINRWWLTASLAF